MLVNTFHIEGLQYILPDMSRCIKKVGLPSSIKICNGNLRLEWETSSNFYYSMTIGAEKEGRICRVYGLTDPVYMGVETFINGYLGHVTCKVPTDKVLKTVNQFLEVIAAKEGRAMYSHIRQNTAP